MAQLVKIVVELSSDFDNLNFIVMVDNDDATQTIGNLKKFPNDKQVQCGQCGSHLGLSLYLRSLKDVDILQDVSNKPPLEDSKEFNALSDCPIISAQDFLEVNIKSEPADYLGEGSEPTFDYMATNNMSKASSSSSSSSNSSSSELESESEPEPEPDSPKKKPKRRKSKTSSSGGVRDVKNAYSRRKPIKAGRDVLLEEYRDIYLAMKKKVRGFKDWPFYEMIAHEDGNQLHFFKKTNNSELYMCNFDLRPMACDICGEKFNDNPSLTAFIKHRNLHFFEDGTLTCIACNTLYSSKYVLARHTLVCKFKKTLKALTCKFCGKEFNNYKTQRVHELDHRLGDRRKRMCHLCSKVLANSSRLKHHMRQAHGMTQYQCHHCMKKFVDRNGTRQHLYEKHFQQFCEFRCEACAKPFATKSRLQSHLEMTHRESKVLCDICNNEFSNPLILRTHMTNAHSDIQDRKKWYCDSCGKMFLSKHALMSHQDNHLKPEDYQFKCEHCGKAFPNKYKLKSHSKVHTEPLTTCSYCGKTFNSKYSLKDHINIHTGEKPYVCKVCQKRFTDRSNLRSHLKGHESSMGIKLTLTKEERRLVHHKVITVDLPDTFPKPPSTNE